MNPLRKTKAMVALLAAASIPLMQGCSKQETPPATPSAPVEILPDLTQAPEETPAVAAAPAELPPLVEVAPDQPLGGTGRPLTEEEMNLLNYGLYMFKEEKGRHPRDLNEAVAARYIVRLPSLPSGERYDYNPQTGIVKVLKEK